MDEYSSAPPTRNVTCAQLRTWISTDLNNTRFRYGIQIDFSPIFFFLFLAQQAEKKVKRRSNQRSKGETFNWNNCVTRTINSNSNRSVKLAPNLKVDGVTCIFSSHFLSPRESKAIKHFAGAQVKRERGS